MMPNLHTHYCTRLLVACLFVCVLPACSRTKPARFYVLTPMPVAESVQPIRTSRREHIKRITEKNLVLFA